MILVICLFISTIAMNQNIIDTEWKFKLNIPASWSQNAYMDGADKVYDFYSADQNAAASIRIFEINAQVTYEILIPLYEQNMFSAANRIELKDLTSKNGIPGKQAIYSMVYNGNQVDIAVFYTLQNNKAYVLSAMVARSVAENYRSDIQLITGSFKIDGVGNTGQSNSLSGLMGKVGQNNSGSSSSIVGRYLFDYSTGDNRTNFNRIFIYQDGTYKHEYQPKNSGNYIGGSTGTWSLNGNTLTLTNNGGITDVYTVSGRKITRKAGNTLMVYYKE